MPAERQREVIEKTFAAATELYAERWSEFFHFALFETGDESWEEAFENTHRKYAEALAVAGARDVLEVACGRGGFAEFLARTSDARVLATDLSRVQLARARRRRHPKLRFERRDVMELGTLGQTFDAVACIDAACYFLDKRAAVATIGHVVRPCGRFLLVDWCRQDGLNRLQQELVLEPLMRFWAIPGFETARNYEKYLERSGFRVLELRDLNDVVARNWELAYEQAVDAVRRLSYEEAARLGWKAKRLGRDGARIVKEQFAAALYIKAAYDAGFLRYTYVLAERK